MDDVGRIDAMQNHVHDGNDIGQALLLLAVKGLGLQGFQLAGGQIAFAQVIVRFTQKAR